MNADVVSSQHRAPRSTSLWHVSVVAFVTVWWLVYQQLIPVSEWITSLFPLERQSHTGEAIAFFFYDVPKSLTEKELSEISQL
ncbi:MAG: hypothetical protein IE937_12905 [Gammaproteobacteria bacterium]|nr:hypothetical protein [Gammaproteobacteria bacterium]